MSISDYIVQPKDGARHSSTISTRFGFSSAAATRSLSFSCLLTAYKTELLENVKRF
jgi:hypothetical protein